MWPQAQNIVLRARHIMSCLNVIVDRLSRPNQPIMTEWSLHSATVFVPKSKMPAFLCSRSDSAAFSAGSGCSVLGLAVEVNVHVSAFPLLNKVIHKLRDIQDAEVILIAAWLPFQPWFPHLLSQP